MKDWRNLHGVPAWFLLFFWGGGGAVGVVDDDEFCWFISFWFSSVLVKKDAAENDAAISEWKASRNLKGKEKTLIWFFSLSFLIINEKISEVDWLWISSLIWCQAYTATPITHAPFHLYLFDYFLAFFFLVETFFQILVNAFMRNEFDNFDENW